MKDYRFISHAYAVKLGLAEESYDGEYTTCLVLYEDDQPLELIATDGGEPEDQTFDRDFGWVAEALNNAYKQGRKDAYYDPNCDES